MRNEQIEEFLSKLTRKCCVLSFTVGGLWFKIDFSGSNFKGIYTFSIESDSWIFVDDINSKNDYSSIVQDDNNFNKYRREAILGIYDLTGYDINSINLNNTGILEIFVSNKKISFIPYAENQYYEGPYWHIIVNSDKYGHYWVVRNNDGDIDVNKTISFESSELSPINRKA